MAGPGRFGSPALRLGLATGVGAGLITLLFHMTAGRIEQSERRALRQALEATLPPGTFDNDLLAGYQVSPSSETNDLFSGGVYPALSEGRWVATILPVVANGGYNGAIRLLVGIWVDGTVAGVRVVTHQETPGLGDRIEAGKSDWIHGFDGRSLNDPGVARWRVKREGGAFDQMTGATITSQAVIRAVEQSLTEFRNRRPDLPTGDVSTQERHHE